MKNRSVGSQLSFALYSATGRMMRLHKPILEPLGLTFPQYLVVLQLLDEAPATVGSLGASLGMDTGTITPLVKRMEAAGVLQRARDQVDERRVMVDLTSSGRALERDVRAVTARIKSACQLSNKELNELRETLDALANPASAETQKTVKERQS